MTAAGVPVRSVGSLDVGPAGATGETTDGWSAARHADRFVRRRSDAVAAVIGLAVLGLGMLAVRHGTVSSFEERVFRAINDLPGALYPVLWPFQQLGAILVGPLVAVVALVLRKYRLAIAALLVTVAKLVLERVVKAMVSRQRPSTSIGLDIHRRGTVSVTARRSSPATPSSSPPWR